VLVLLHYAAPVPREVLPSRREAFAESSSRAGRPQRSEDRTGPATSGGGRRPHLIQRKEILHVRHEVA
jgi:hypothetical protein